MNLEKKVRASERQASIGLAPEYEGCSNARKRSLAVSLRRIFEEVCIPWTLTRRLEELLRRAQDDITVAIGAQEAAD